MIGDMALRPKFLLTLSALRRHHNVSLGGGGGVSMLVEGNLDEEPIVSVDNSDHGSIKGEPHDPRFDHDRKFARWVALVLMGIWVWWWWTESWGGAFWVIPAVVFLGLGEIAPEWLSLVRFITIPVYTLLSPILRPLEALAVKVLEMIPAVYREPLAARKPIGADDILTPEQKAEMEAFARKRGLMPDKDDDVDEEADKSGDKEKRDG